MWSYISGMWSYMKPITWGAISGGIAWWVILAFGFGWMSAGTAQKLAQQRADQAVVAALAPVCAEKFMAQPDANAKKEALAKASSWNRRDMFTKQWVTLPGENVPDRDLVEACSALVLKAAYMRSLKTLSSNRRGTDRRL